MTFDEFLHANHEEALIQLRNEAYGNLSIEQAFHDKLVEYFRTYLLVGGMPESVLAWIESQQNLLLIEYQRVKYFKECNC